MNADLCRHWNFCVGSEPWSTSPTPGPSEQAFQREGRYGRNSSRLNFQWKEPEGNLLAQMLPSSSSWSILSPFSHVFNYDFYTSTSTGTTLTQDSFTSVVTNHNSIQTVTTALHHLSQDSNELKRVWWWTGGPPRWYFQLKFPWFNLCFGSTGKNSMVACCFSGWSMT